MKYPRLERIYLVTLLVIFGGVVLHAPLSVGLGTLFPDYELMIKSWKEILMLALVPLAAIIVTKRHLWKELFKDWVIRLTVAYAGLHLLLIPVSFDGLASVAAGLAIDLRYILFFALVYVAVRTMPEWRRKFIQVGTVGAFVVVGFATIQLFLPPDFLKIIGYSRDTIVPYLTVDQNPDYIRYSSTLRGPNPLGAYAGMVLAMLTAAAMKGKLQLQNKKVLIGTIILGMCGAIALWINYSRSALVAGIIAVLIVLTMTVGQRLSRRSWVTACVVVFAIAGALVVGRGSEFVSNVILHENLAGGSSISSNDDHVSSLSTGLDRLIHQPFGGGVGSTGSASLHGSEPIIIENQYLFIAHETGWVGLLLFSMLFAWILVRLWQRRQDWFALGTFAGGIGLALIGLLLPVWADDTVSIVWWGLAAIALGGTYGKTAKQKTKRTA
jgi:O-antigen ligase/polysaccharide polymerase Wzy-like membrane protein